MKIRKAYKQDYAILPSVETDAARVFKEYDLAFIANMEPSSAEFYEQLPKSAAVFVAEDQKADITGFAVVTEIDNQAYLKEISVRKASSGKGVGRALLNKTLLWSQKRYQWIVLTTFVDLPFNAPFYKKVGFHEFTPDESWRELRALRYAEHAAGLDVLPRVTMIRELENG